MSSRTDKMRCGFSAHTRLFFSCQTLLTHPAHFQPSTRCFENVSDVLPNYADNIRTPHVCLTGSGLNYFYATSSTYSSEWDWIRNLSCLHVSVRQMGKQHRQQPLLEMCKFSLPTVPATLCILFMQLQTSYTTKT